MENSQTKIKNNVPAQPNEKSISEPLHGKSRSQWQLGLSRLAHNQTAMAGLVILVIVSILVVLAPLISPYNPESINVKSILESPNAAHWFGTDDLGRDLFTRVLWGGRESIRVGFLAVLIAVSGGIVVGLVSGYFGGILDTIVQRLSEIILAFPSILFLLSIIAVLGPSLTTALVAIGISAIPGYTRLVRGSVLSVKNMEYVTSARLVGARNMRIMFVHILPNMIAPILVYATLGLGSAIMLTAGLSYIGLGAQPPSPEWGAMLNYGRSFIRNAFWMSLFPGLAISMVVLSINLLGDGLRDALDPKMN